MKKILAVSGGVDSMLLLWRFRNDEDAVVAHFNHGTRSSANEDAEFVEQMSEKYGIEFFYGEAKLGPDVSEAEARNARYNFLKTVSLDQGGIIYTAHHLNDLAETIAINITRGTGWRGLAPFSDMNIERPFINEKMTKEDILKEAANLGISYRQDPTNTEENYLRNRLREKFSQMSKNDLLEIYDLFQRQTLLRKEIEETCISLVDDIVSGQGYRRDAFRALDDKVAIEILREICLQNYISLTRPQTIDLLEAIRHYLPGKKFNLPKDKMVTIRKEMFYF